MTPALGTVSPDDIINRLGLSRHPEGGHYRQTWVADAQNGARPTGTAIYFLLKPGERSHWHRVDATEIWHWYAGSPLELSQAPTDAGPCRRDLLGPDITAGQQPQLIVPEHHWQAAYALDGWALVGCTVSPGFRFEGFDLAAPGFDIP
ncbi:cupin domain-containing protein [Sagittula marina]|nr:cupin domain-containing protein [Sagittula marina]